MKIRAKELRGLGIWLLAASQLTLFSGCRQLGGGSGPGNSGSTAPGATAGPDIGLILYNVLHQNLQTNGNTGEVTALETDKTEFVAAVDQILPTAVSSNLFPLLQKLIPLVKDNTIPNGLSDVEGMVKDLLNSPSVIAALADLQAGAQVPSSLNGREIVLLLSRLLGYNQLDQLAQAMNGLLQTNPDVIANLQAVVANLMEGVTPATFQSSPLNLQGLTTTLLSPVDMTGFGNLGNPAWACKVDKNGNPAVAIDGVTGQVYAPFVDDGTGIAMIDSAGKPIDMTGAEINIAPLGTDGSRDSYGRALASDGNPLYDYFDAKQTLICEIMILFGNLIRAGVPLDLETVVNAIASTVQHPGPDAWTGFSGNCPLVDFMCGGIEVMRDTPMPQLLQGMSIMINQNPQAFEQTVNDLVIGINLAIQSGFSSAGSGNMLNQLLPMLSQAAAIQGNNTSAIRATLEAFNTSQAQLQNLPQGFALMMQYNDYGTKTPTGPGLPSEMSRLLDIMYRSNQCSPIILGNLADLYINTMAGNAPSILGLSLSISQMNSLLGIGPLRSLLCSQLNADDVGVLQDFVNTGSLDAFTPIAKAFSDNGETHLLVEIMLALQSTYATSMAPNEPAIIKLLNSGAVNKLFSAINQMTTITVPSNNEKLIDVLADFVAAMVNNKTPVTDHLGRSFPTLIQLLQQPLTDLTTECTNAGVESNLQNVISGLEGQLLSTYTDANGNQQMVYNGLVSTLGSTLNFLAQQIPTNTTDLNTWCNNQETTITNMFTGRNFAAIAQFILAVKGSPNCQVFSTALATLFTPQTDPTQDGCGAMLQLLAALLQAQPVQTSANSATDMATVLNFLGGELDPANGKTTNLINMMEKMIAADNGLLLLTILRNATNMGPNGNQTAPIITLQTVYSDVTAQAPASAGGTAGITATLNKIVGFMDDQTNGLPHFIQLIDSN